jgi:ribosomal protein S18 acetylase RimI-like enzyme
MGPNMTGGPTSEGPSEPPRDLPDRGSPVSMTVRLAHPSDAPAAGRLHADRISDGFLSFLGTGFLARLYRRITLDPDSFLLVAESDTETVGFIAGSTNVRNLYRHFLLRDAVPATLAAAPRLLVGWRRAVETFRHGTSEGTVSGRGAELLAVAVAHGSVGQGLGGQLVNAFLDEIISRSCLAAHVVVGADNSVAVALYERCGFVIADRFELHAGITSLLMQWDRPAQPTASGPGRDQ